MTLPSPQYDLFTENRPGYFYARVRTVALGPGLIPGLFADIRTAILEKRFARFLFEFEMAHALTEDETYELMNQLMARFAGMRIALVSSDPRHRPLIPPRQQPAAREHRVNPVVREPRAPGLRVLRHRRIR